MAASNKQPAPRIKGVAMLNAVRALQSMGKDKAMALLPAHLHKYLEGERILAGSWYLESEMLEVNRALARMIRPTLGRATLEETFVHMGRLVGRIDLSSVYATMHAAGELEASIHCVSASWRQYHDTGVLKASASHQSAHFELSDYGLPTNELCWIQRGWFEAYIEMAGPHEFAVFEVQCRNRGAPTCAWEAKWTK